MTNTIRISIAAILAGAIGAPVEAPAEIHREVLPMAPAQARLPFEGHMPSLAGATEWLNSPPLTTSGLRGKVVLDVIGVHSPEFPFEKDIANVRRSAKQMMVDYPIAVDSDHAVWRAFHNEYWPALYLVDAKGRIR